jgi:hypothetical protein
MPPNDAEANVNVIPTILNVLSLTAEAMSSMLSRFRRNNFDFVHTSHRERKGVLCNLE